MEKTINRIAGYLAIIRVEKGNVLYNSGPIRELKSYCEYFRVFFLGIPLFKYRCSNRER